MEVRRFILYGGNFLFSFNWRRCFHDRLLSERRIHIHRRRCFCGSFLRNERFGFLDSCFFDFRLDRHF